MERATKNEREKKGQTTINLYISFHRHKRTHAHTFNRFWLVTLCAWYIKMEHTFGWYESTTTVQTTVTVQSNLKFCDSKKEIRSDFISEYLEREQQQQYLLWCENHDSTNQPWVFIRRSQLATNDSIRASTNSTNCLNNKHKQMLKQIYWLDACVYMCGCKTSSLHIM